MRKKLRFYFILFLAFTGFHQAYAQHPVNAVMAQRLQDKLDSCVNHYNVPGISVSLLLPGNRYWNGASGLSDIYANIPLDTTMLFQNASATKMYVAAMIFQLAEEGLLSIEDTVGKYIAPIVYIPGNTKIRYLLNHRSGLYDFIAQNPASGSTFFAYPDSVWDHRLSIETYIDAPMFPQGSSFYYCNTNYVLLGMIIEQITGHTFTQELHDRFITPYGLTQTFMPPEDTVMGVETPGWTSFSAPGVYDTDAAPLFHPCFESMIFTAGAMVTQPSDLCKFTRLLHGGQILNDTSLTRMKQFTPVSAGGGNGYGHGCIRYPFAGGKTYYGHSGDISGFTQFSAHNPIDSITITVSINRNNAPRIPIAQAILNVLYTELSVSDEKYAGEMFAVYPNPATDRVQVQVKSVDGAEVLNIYNNLGEKVRSQSLAGQSPYMFDLAGFKNGIYYLELTGKTFSQTKKLVVNR